jgi:hypothetical protein
MKLPREICEFRIQMGASDSSMLSWMDQTCKTVVRPSHNKVERSGRRRTIVQCRRRYESYASGLVAPRQTTKKNTEAGGLWEKKP